MFSPRFYGLSSCWAPFGPLAPQERHGHRDDHLVGCLGNCTATACAETWLPEEACDEFFRLGEGNSVQDFLLHFWWNECCNILCFVALLVTFTLFPRYNLFFMNRWFTRRWQIVRDLEALKPRWIYLNLVEPITTMCTCTLKKRTINNTSWCHWWSHTTSRGVVPMPCMAVKMTGPPRRPSFMRPWPPSVAWKRRILTLHGSQHLWRAFRRRGNGTTGNGTDGVGSAEWKMNVSK